jgi:glycyl-tRNA synthetase beta chain
MSDIRPLLVELLTEELPPKALRKLGESFAEGIRLGLETHGLLAAGCAMQPYATPRRLAVLLTAVLAQAPDQEYSEKLMPVKVGLDADGRPTPALLKKLAAKGLDAIDAASLARESDGKQDYLVARGTAPGARLPEGLQQALDSAIAGLPIPKVMSYQLADGVTTVKFVRPAHGLVALFGADVVDISALGLAAGRATLGHRFLSEGAIALRDPLSYARQLEDEGRVIAAFETRRDEVRNQLNAHEARLDATVGDDPEVSALLEEVTALVEYPHVYVGEFEPRFLQVPQECLILTMRLNQK